MCQSVRNWLGQDGQGVLVVVIGEEGQSKGFSLGDCQLVIGKLEFFTVRDRTNVSVSAGLGGSL